MISGSEEAVRVVRRLRERGHEAYFVGGWVRDLLLGGDPKDADIATSATPDEVERIFPHSHPVGKAFGVMHVVEGDTHVEVATFRSEGEYRDGRRPSGVEFTGMREDASRRDFTINALYFDPETEEVIDPLGARGDLDARLLRAVGDPDERFREDHLRLLRAVRLAVTLDFEMEEATLQAVLRHAHLAGRVAGERVREELERCLASPRRAASVRLLRETGLLEALLPEVAGAAPGEPGEEGPFSVILEVLGGLPASASLGLALAALLRGCDDQEAGAVADRLRLSRKERDRLTWLVRHREALDAAPAMPKAEIRRWLAEPGFPDLLALLRAREPVSERARRARPILDAARERWPEHPAPLVDGDDLLRLGVEPGPEMGRLLEAIETAQLAEEISGREEALALAERLARRRGLLPSSRG